MMTAPFTFSHLDHLVLRTEQPSRLADFYLSLGCTVERDLSDSIGLLQLRMGASLLDIVDVNGQLGKSGGAGPGDEARNLDHFAVRVEPFDGEAILSFCEAQGYEAAKPAQNLLGADGYGPAVYVTDPDGNRIELKGPPEK